MTAMAKRELRWVAQRTPPYKLSTKRLGRAASKSRSQQNSMALFIEDLLENFGLQKLVSGAMAEFRPATDIFEDLVPGHPSGYRNFQKTFKNEFSIYTQHTIEKFMIRHYQCYMLAKRVYGQRGEQAFGKDFASEIQSLPFTRTAKEFKPNIHHYYLYSHATAFGLDTLWLCSFNLNVFVGVVQLLDCFLYYSYSSPKEITIEDFLCGTRKRLLQNPDFVLFFKGVRRELQDNNANLEGAITTGLQRRIRYGWKRLIQLGLSLAIPLIVKFDLVPYSNPIKGLTVTGVINAAVASIQNFQPEGGNAGTNTVPLDEETQMMQVQNAIATYQAPQYATEVASTFVLAIIGAWMNTYLKQAEGPTSSIYAAFAAVPLGAFYNSRLLAPYLKSTELRGALPTAITVPKSGTLQHAPDTSSDEAPTVTTSEEGDSAGSWYDKFKDKVPLSSEGTVQVHTFSQIKDDETLKKTIAETVASGINDAHRKNFYPHGGTFYANLKTCILDPDNRGEETTRKIAKAIDLFAEDDPLTRIVFQNGSTYTFAFEFKNEIYTFNFKTSEAAEKLLRAYSNTKEFRHDELSKSKTLQKRARAANIHFEYKINARPTFYKSSGKAVLEWKYQKTLLAKGAEETTLKKMDEGNALINPFTLQVSLDLFNVENCETRKQALALCLLLADKSDKFIKEFKTEFDEDLLKKMLLSEEPLTAKDVLGGLENELLLEIFNDQENKLFPNVRAFIRQ